MMECTKLAQEARKQITDAINEVLVETPDPIPFEEDDPVYIDGQWIFKS
jgi:hypothetical protein